MASGMIKQRQLILLQLLWSLPGFLHADLVITKDGSRLVGEVIGLNDGNLTLDTQYAGKVRISLPRIEGIRTDESSFLRLEDNRTLSGPLAPAPQGSISIGIPPTEIPIANLQQLWRLEGSDPLEVARLKKLESAKMKWSSKLGFDLSGTSGNTEDFGLGFRLDSSYANKRRETDVYLSYNNSHKEGLTIVDETKGGAEYASQFQDHLAWYAKTDLETDRLEEIDLRATVASGLKYIVTKEETQELAFRAGAAFRYESYEAQSMGDFDDPAIDFGLEHSHRFSEFLSIESDVTYVPSIEDFGNYLLTQDSALVVPLGKKSPWKLRSGLANSYNSTPAPGKEGLDLKYYLRLVYSWD